MVTLEIGIDYM